MSTTFYWKGLKVTAYEFHIAGMAMIGMDCETVYETAITQFLGAYNYPYMSMNRFKELLAAKGLSNEPFDIPDDVEVMLS